MTTGSSNMTVRWIRQATGWVTRCGFRSLWETFCPSLCFYVYVYRMLFSCRTVIGWWWRTPSLNLQPLTTVWPSLSNTQIHGEPVSQSSSTSQTHDQLLANHIAVCSMSVKYKRCHWKHVFWGVWFHLMLFYAQSVQPFCWMYFL